VGEDPSGRPRPDRRERRDPRPLRAREVAFLMFVWTAILASSFGVTVLGGAIGRLALVLAVGGLFAVIWLFGLVILGLFLARGD
jgi:hypothetical protein